MKTTPIERMELLIGHLKKSKHAISLSIGDKSSSRINFVLNGRNNISEKLACDIVNTYQHISYLWLMTGDGSIEEKKYKKASNALQEVREDKVAIEKNRSVYKNYIMLLEEENKNLEFEKKKLELTIKELNFEIKYISSQIEKR